MTITEFDEQAENKTQAMENLAHAYTLYRKDEETYGALSGYQDTAIGHGATWTEIEALQKRIAETHKGEMKRCYYAKVYQN